MNPYCLTQPAVKSERISKTSNLRLIALRPIGIEAITSQSTCISNEQLLYHTLRPIYSEVYTSDDLRTLYVNPNVNLNLVNIAALLRSRVVETSAYIGLNGEVPDY